MKRFLLSLLSLCYLASAAQADRFWVGGTGTWDAVTTTHWSASSGGAGGASVPTSADNAFFDGSSGGGTVTVNFGGTVTVAGVVTGAFTGTWDNSVNNNNFSLVGGGFSSTGTGTRTIKLGTATYTINTGTVIDFTTTTGLTLVAGSETWTWTGTSGARAVNTGGKSFGSLTMNSNQSTAPNQFGQTFTGNGTFANLTIVGPIYLRLTAGETLTVTGAFTWTGQKDQTIALQTTTFGSTATIVATGGGTMSYTSLRDMIFTTGTVTATNSMDGGNNSGVTVSGLSAGGPCILGGWLLWRDMPEHLNDNFPAWLEKAG